ncbi:SAM-dependent methyltransferase [Desulfobaculum xiamenense]|uniref:SAM-dependent methyltransferase n=1 Tax=Desulfobaculum xiamenense TaxID=995050 RepID=A0A846QKT8_9BACT|nr:class I SAM-dependent methyltransferase [Desulfobaculum xiamenense]NJB68741.1 SAM-dependent methyltransferase [Desulfobaculum xiamenense]
MTSDKQRTVTEFYDSFAEQFFRETAHLDISAAWEPFLAAMPEHANILDAGCGSGRDSLYFAKLGHKVTAFDASQAMVERAREHTGLCVHQLRFDEMTWDGEFDGVWANASLLHLSEDELLTALSRIATALRPGGTAYASFKYGQGTHETRGGALFHNACDEERLARLVANVPSLRTVQTWVTGDRRPDHVTQKWLNALICRQQ